MGRIAAPAQSKVIAGNFRGDRDSHGAKIEIGLPPCPKWLGRAAKRHWQEVGPELVKAGLIALIDGDVFAVHCDTAAKFAEVTQKLKTIDDALVETPQKFIVQSALFTVRSKLLEQLVKTGREFGMTPSARSGIKTPEQGQLALGGWDNV
ncbi:MAG: hypothetical protein JWM78_1653 [Verrucomicrobiaceae bacterium]|nr:hypothetical protein [Verrucomicrobiaceae bacterium]